MRWSELSKEKLLPLIAEFMMTVPITYETPCILNINAGGRSFMCETRLGSNPKPVTKGVQNLILIAELIMTVAFTFETPCILDINEFLILSENTRH